MVMTYTIINISTYIEFHFLKNILVNLTVLTGIPMSIPSKIQCIIYWIIYKSHDVDDYLFARGAVTFGNGWGNTFHWPLGGCALSVQITTTLLLYRSVCYIVLCWIMLCPVHFGYLSHSKVLSQHASRLVSVIFHPLHPKWKQCQHWL